LNDARVMRILAAALEAVEPYRLVWDFLEGAHLPKYHRIVLLGLGKAAEPMTRAAADRLNDYSDALVITKHASGNPVGRITVLEGGHPIPDERSLGAGKAVLDFVSKLLEDDLLLCLISGGGSSLVSLPFEEIQLSDLQDLTGALLGSGANIHEINIVRRQTDRIKGGGLARLTRAKIVSLIISDAIGDRIETVASGPTVENSTTGRDALAIIEKYHITISQAVERVLSGKLPASEGSPLGLVKNVAIGNNLMAAKAGMLRARSEGFDSAILASALQEEARVAGVQLAKRLRLELTKRIRPFCLIAGGETTVSVRGTGKGGRNQELALAAVREMEDLRDVLLVSLATDGEDGTTDAAGAAVTGESCRRATNLGMLAEDYLVSNDAYTFFESLADLIKPGITGTNVNDLVLVIAF
jgi:glycerate 2-kinase